MSEETGKKKLTLTVDEKVIERAKDLGINISEVTESVLRGFAFKPSGEDREEEYRKYVELFASMRPLLEQYGAWVNVGEYDKGVDLNLTADGRIFMPEFEDYLDNIHSIELWHLYSPKKILANFVSALTDAKERRKEKLGELEMAKRIVEAITESMRSSSPSKKAGTN